MLSQATACNTPVFSLRDRRIIARVIAVYDGDTCTVALRFHWNSPIVAIKVRLCGIDTPELRSKVPAEKHQALTCRSILRSIVLNQTVLLHCSTFDKYGRLLASLYVPQTYTARILMHLHLISTTKLRTNAFLDVSAYMITHGPGTYVYQGGTRRPFATV
jgi:micrococcal nuclease